jgi:hypothetical protein
VAINDKLHLGWLHVVELPTPPGLEIAHSRGDDGGRGCHRPEHREQYHPPRRALLPVALTWEPIHRQVPVPDTDDDVLDPGGKEADEGVLGGGAAGEAERRVEEGLGRPWFAHPGDAHGQAVCGGVVLDPHSPARSRAVGRDGDVEADGRLVRAVRPHRPGHDGREAASGAAGSIVRRGVVGEAAEAAPAVQREPVVEDDERDWRGAGQREAGVERRLEGRDPAGAGAPDVDGPGEQQEALGAVELGEGAVVVEEEGGRQEDGRVGGRHEVPRRGAVEGRVAEGVRARRRRGAGDGCRIEHQDGEPAHFSGGGTVRARHRGRCHG